jgi:DNA modification methylase
VWSVDKPAVNDLHPTMKPVELVQRAVCNSSQTKGLVFDPFAGSGSTLIACETTGRHGRLIELDPRYVDVIVKRWQGYTGQRAVLEGDGREFEQIALERS